MSEFKVAYENQTGEFVKKRFEIALPVILPEDLVSSVDCVKSIINGETPENSVKKNKKNELVVTQKEKVSPSSLIMIGVAVAMAALTGKSK